MSLVNKKKIKGVLFDLDGTLYDTAPELVYTLNTLLEKSGISPLPFSEVRPYVNQGVSALIKKGFQINESHDYYEAYCKKFPEIYYSNLARETNIFAEIDSVLSFLETHELKWGIVTNKHTSLTKALMKRIALNPLPGCVVCGDSLKVSKPHPEPLLHAARLIGIEPKECIYIGDAERDIVAGKSANMLTMVAMYGYIGAEDEPAAWSADYYAETPREIIKHLEALI